MNSKDPCGHGLPKQKENKEGSSPVAKRHSPKERQKEGLPASREGRETTHLEAAPDASQEGSSPVLSVAKQVDHDNGLPQGEVWVGRLRGLLGKTSSSRIDDAPLLHFFVLGFAFS